MGRKTDIEMKRLAQDKKSWRKQNRRPIDRTLDDDVYIYVPYINIFIYIGLIT